MDIKIQVSIIITNTTMIKLSNYPSSKYNYWLISIDPTDSTEVQDKYPAMYDYVKKLTSTENKPKQTLCDGNECPLA